MLSLRHAIYRASSVANGNASRTFLAKPQLVNSHLSQASRVLGSRLRPSQVRFFTEDQPSTPRARITSSLYATKSTPATPIVTSPKSTVYFGNLHFDTTADDLKTLSTKFGNIEASRIIYDPRGLSRGFGYVKFQNTDIASEAVKQLHHTEFEGRVINVNFAQHELTNRAATMNKEVSSPTRTVYIGNIAHQITDNDLHEIFDPIPGVVDVRVAVDRRTGMPRGFAHAEFTDVESAVAGFERLQGQSPYGRTFRLDYSLAESRPRSDSRNRWNRETQESEKTQDQAEAATIPSV